MNDRLFSYGAWSVPRLAAMAILLSGTFARADSRVSYTALSDAARASGQLSRYDGAAATSGTLQLGDYRLAWSVPQTARAYDVIPIRYTLRQPAGNRRAAVEAVAFEDPAKVGDRPLYDLAIPGAMGINVEYLGHVRASYAPDQYVPLTADPKSPISPFPPYVRDAAALTSTIRAGDLLWFHFRLTNTGDTILDPEGFGASFVEATISKLGAAGGTEWTAGTVNLYERHLNYLYPGESVELWVNFHCAKDAGGRNRGLSPGDYRIDFNVICRLHAHWNWGSNIWGGTPYARLSVPIKVTDAGGQTPVRPTYTVLDSTEKMPGYFDRFEEFMTAFRIHQPVAAAQPANDTVYLQVAPWTRQVTLKLILTDPKQIAVVRVPIAVGEETLRIKYNPDNVMTIKKNGREEPVIVAQALPGMREGIQLGPYPEQHMRQAIREMKALGVNLFANSSAGWWIPEVTGRKTVEMHSACYKFWYDVLMREEGLTALGWSVYPPTEPSWYQHVAPLLGHPLNYQIQADTHGYGQWVDPADPAVPKMIAAWAKFNYARWGDTWFKTRDGRMPIDIEDTWGWMRDDINIRNARGPLTCKRFQEWLNNKYKTCETLNAAWGTHYTAFSQINPEAGQGIEGDGMAHGPVYNKPENPFHDWSKPAEDWDVFRTELRLDIYRQANALLRKSIPNGELSLRCEGATMIVAGDPRSAAAHGRHAYYSQRRNALVQDAVRRAGVLHFFSDYTTLPYTDAEWRSGMREMVGAGIIPAFLPQFDHMRDILLNSDYGRAYQMHYHLDQPQRGLMIHCLTAAYPWWKATYEEGGAPGIAWSDYLCDGFATETQKRELRLLRDQFDRLSASSR
jgi:hypothetical protein